MTKIERRECQGVCTIYLNSSNKKATITIRIEIRAISPKIPFRRWANANRWLFKNKPAVNGSIWNSNRVMITERGLIVLKLALPKYSL